MKKIQFLKRLILDQRGAAAVEYGLIVAMIVLAIMAGLNNFASKVMNQWNHIGNETERVM